MCGVLLGSPKITTVHKYYNHGLMIINNNEKDLITPPRPSEEEQYSDIDGKKS